MTNSKAIKIILQNKKPSNAERLAAMYACEDIVSTDVEEWKETDVSEHITQFLDIASDLAKDLLKEDIISKNKLAEGLVDVTESVYHYVRFYENINKDYD
tara:strand:+ start:3661 stop:3960 length:300 start_codon:yes stop_codon:yes gene_type:complete